MENTNVFYIYLDYTNIFYKYLARKEPENACLHNEDESKVNKQVLIAPK